VRHAPTATVLALLLAVALTTASARAAEGPTPAPGSLQPSDPCTFYRGQAYGKGMEHVATEMLWACEAIAQRRAANLPLGDRLEAAAAAIERYRTAVIVAAMKIFGRSRGPRFGLSEVATRELADSTGALVALEGISTGF
jgi:hypothetical protein